MAERRMFAKTIIDSDAFLDMPLSAQALYFHLSMRADVVEVVRCKDCRMANEEAMIDGRYYCSNDEMTHNPEQFCSYGERRKKRGQ